MKIYLNGRFLTQQTTGVQRFANEIVKELDNLNLNKLEFEILVPRNTNLKIQYKNIKIRKVGYLKGHLWEQIELPFFSNGNLLINFCNLGPGLKRNQIVVIHDAAIYYNSNTYSKSFRIWYRILYKLISLFSKKILTVSKFSRKELIRYTRINENKISIISEGNEHFKRLKPDSSILKKHNLEKNSYILAVSSINPNKNFGNIIKALNLISDKTIKVVIAGGKNERVFKELNGFKGNNSVKEVGFVSDEELKSLYQNALCFIFPSFYEGFGLPPLEAMSCGCPVIVSNTASMPEVCGNAALYINPHNPKEIADNIDLIVNNSNLREDLKLKGIQQSNNFSWSFGAKTLLSIINEVTR